ncbi:dihydrodipicolinate synthase family protein [Opitutus sp. ER46]|uniref:dihydrodipicolinate synthase family protein n=1 Tax=Opitutus sp. ER46 TaxID=2161864 RepID=UPI000D304C40|nr:dihydrodipicolinate synthase family protein [Opitutus sp. ER46]PTX94497.1 dihydrodipicolinate synthetase [Opitutus sp. ER46]
MNFRLPGLTAAPFTAFRANGEVNLDMIPQQAALLARNGVSGAFICGTTGEGASMTSTERMSIAEAWLKARQPGLKVIVHVGHLALGDARALAAHAQAKGADAIATVAPCFFKPGANELVAWCGEVAAAAPKLPFFYYYMPSMTHVTVPAAEFLARAADRIPTLAGVKFTYEDLADFRAAKAFQQERFEVLFGRDEILLSGLELGATGAVGSTYNYAAPLYRRVIEAFRAGDLATAKREQAKAQAFIDVMNGAGGLPAGKAIMKMIGLDCGPVRLPLRSLTPEQEKRLEAGLRAVGFFDYASK